MRSVDVSRYMQKRPVVVTADTDLFRAIQQILEHRISGVTVIDERNRPVGMLSELDCLRAILKNSYHQEEIGTQLVGDHMTVGVECTSAREDVFDIAVSMLDHKHRRRPVLNDQGEMVGQLTCRQLLGAIKDFDLPSR